MRAITETVEAIVPEVVRRAAEDLSEVLTERTDVTEGLRAAIESQAEAVAAQTRATSDLRAEVAKPKPLTRKRVITDDIGRITAVEEEQI